MLIFTLLPLCRSFFRCFSHYFYGEVFKDTLVKNFMVYIRLTSEAITQLYKQQHLNQKSTAIQRLLPHIRLIFLVICYVSSRVLPELVIIAMLHHFI